MTMKDLQKWIEKDIPRSKCDVQLACGTVDGYNEYKFYLYTETNKYAIYAKTDSENGYLGFIAESRKARPGEDWLRGNDLPDGPLTKKTWDAIMLAIVRYELKDIAKKVERMVDQ